MITIITSSRYKLNKKEIQRRAMAFLQLYTTDLTAMVNIVFIGTRKMTGIAHNYKHENVALPVLTFPYHENAAEKLLGEVFICYPQAILLAAERGKKVDQILYQLVEHGISNLFK